MAGSFWYWRRRKPALGRRCSASRCLANVPPPSVGHPEAGILPVPPLCADRYPAVGRYCCWRSRVRCPWPPREPHVVDHRIRACAPDHARKPRGFTPPVKSPKPLRMFRPSRRGQRSWVGVFPHPPKPGVAFGKIEFAPSADVARSWTVSDFQRQRIADDIAAASGNKRTRCPAIAFFDCKPWSSVVPSPGNAERMKHSTPCFQLGGRGLMARGKRFPGISSRGNAL